MKSEAIAGAVAPLDSEVEANLPNASRTMEALRELGYSSYASALDLIDNSIDAGADRVAVTVEKSGDDIVITITDDGTGMDRATLGEALRLGSASDHNPTDLGKFGMGLVTASIGLSRHIEVVTKREDSPAYVGWLDLDEIITTNEWVRHTAQATDEQAARILEFSERGTSVRLTRTDKITNRNPSQFADILKKEVGQVYRRFLKTARLQISVNRAPVAAIDPLMADRPGTEVTLEETDIQVDGRAIATVKVVQLPDLGMAMNRDLGINPRNSGFYVLRNNREIAAAQSFDMFTKHPSLAHFRAEISFDGTADDVMHTDVKKGTILPGQAFIDVLKGKVGGLITASAAADKKRAHEGRGKMDHSIVESAVPRKAALIPKPDAWIEKRAKPDKAGKKRTTNGEGTGVRTPRATQFKTPSGLKVEFREGNYGIAFFYSVEQQGNTLVITYNRDHNFWSEYSSHGDSPKVVALVDYLVFALANAEQMLGTDLMDTVKANMNAALVGVLS